MVDCIVGRYDAYHDGHVGIRVLASIVEPRCEVVERVSPTKTCGYLRSAQQKQERRLWGESSLHGPRPLTLRRPNHNATIQRNNDFRIYRVSRGIRWLVWQQPWSLLARPPWELVSGVVTHRVMSYTNSAPAAPR